MKKGISMPINTLVMLAIAIIVLLAATAWFMLSWTRSSQGLDSQQKFKDCCIGYVQANCPSDTSTWTCKVYEGEPEDGSIDLEYRADEAGIPTSQIPAACGCPIDRTGA